MKKNRELMRVDYEIFKTKEISCYTNEINQKFQDSLFDVDAQNGMNACWINTVLFLFFSSPILRNVILSADFIGKENVELVEEMIRKTWDDNLYSFFYKIFEENCDDLENYGEFGNPHSILSFLIDDLMKKEDIPMSLDFDLTISEYSQLQEKLSYSGLHAIIKGTSRIQTEDMTKEYYSDHFVTFVKNGYDWVLFDAMKGGTVSKTVKAEEIFAMEDITQAGTCPYYFIQFDLKR